MKKNYKKRDYFKNRRPNKIFITKKNWIRKKKKILFLFFLSIFLSITAATAYFFLFSKYFQINNIAINGNEKNKTEKILLELNKEMFAQKIFFIIPYSNYWLIKEKYLEFFLKEKFNLDNIKIIKKYPNRLNIKIAEKQPRFILITDNKHSLLDGQGFIIEEIDKSDLDIFNHLPQISSDFELFDFLPDVNNIKIIDTICDFLKNNDQQCRLTAKDKKYQIAANFQNFKIYFNLNKNINEQIDKLKKI
ncbi:MAG: hypothetical protein U9O66_01985, partial [Patescibacteria group bacterium]|nr:hypothetical protein [Patescibacteria group bacterium]